jgi:4-hydroxy-tetrahydrodipicolinate synthase
MKELIAAGLKGQVEQARRLHYKLLPLFKALFLETNPIPIKAAMAMKGIIPAIYRLPMCELSPDHEKALEQVLLDLGII